MILASLLSVFCASYIVYDRIQYEINSDNDSTVTLHKLNEFVYEFNHPLPGTFEYGGKTYTVTRVGKKPFLFRNEELKLVWSYFKGEFIMPNTIVELDESAFESCKTDGQIKLSENLVKIGDEATNFDNPSCGYIKGDFIIPDSVKEMGYIISATKFSGSLILPKTIEIINDSTFTFSKFTGDLVIPDNIKRIENSGFSSAEFTGELKLSKNLEFIGVYSFRDDKFIGDLIIPDSVTKIEEYAFFMCIFSGKLALPKYLDLINTSSFQQCNFTGDLIIPDNVKSIGNNAFRNNSFNGKLVLPRVLESIGEYAFYNNSFTGDLVLPASLTDLGKDAFNDTFD